MTDHQQIEDFNLDELTYHCQEQSQRFFQRLEFNPRYCFEIFRRAFVHKNNLAWDRIYRQYRMMVLAWINRHPAIHTLDEEAEYFLNRAFEKMWLGISPEKFLAFADLKSLLRYLQMCVHSVIMDHIRKNRRLDLELDDQVTTETEKLHNSHQHADSVEVLVENRMHAVELWENLRDRLNTQQELVAAKGTFVLALKPRQVLEEFPGVFKTVDEVYRTKENLLARLRRDKDFLLILQNRVGQPSGTIYRGDEHTTSKKNDSHNEKSKSHLVNENERS